MPKPPELLHGPPNNLSVAQWVERLALVTHQVAELEAQLTQPTLRAEARAGILAHIASLSRRKRWYLSRIRRDRPVEQLGVGVAESVPVGESAQ